MTATCTFCSANDAAFTARTTHGVGSAEHRTALAAIDWDAARIGRAHSADCSAMLPLVTFGH